MMNASQLWRGLSLGFLALGLTYAAPPPAQAECPVADWDLDTIQAAIAQATSCPAAIAISRACAFGSGADVLTAGLAGERCLADLEPLEAGDRATLARLLQACGEKYADQDGTMFRSFAAFCQLEVIEGFHGALTPFEPSELEGE